MLTQDTPSPNTTLLSNPIGFTGDPLTIDQNEITQDPMDALIEETIIRVFSEANSSELQTCCLVSRKWKQVADSVLWKEYINKKIAFGKEKWAMYFGDIGKEPPLPENIYQILKTPCSIFSGKYVAQTHMLVLIPEKIEEKDYTLNGLEELVKKPKQGGKMQFRFFHPKVAAEYGNAPSGKSHWALMPKDILPESRSKGYSVQKTLVADLAKQSKMAYEVPNALEAFTCMCVQFVSRGQRLFNSNPTTYTHCIETNENSYQVAVGSFEKGYGPAIVRSYKNENKDDTDNCLMSTWGSGGTEYDDDEIFGITALLRF